MPDELEIWYRYRRWHKTPTHARNSSSGAPSWWTRALAFPTSGGPPPRRKRPSARCQKRFFQNPPW